MDDTLFEERMTSLKTAYDSMRPDTDRAGILAAIKKEEKRHRSKPFYDFPYVASFIGIGMIAGIFLMQTIGQNESPTQSQNGSKSPAVESRSKIEVSKAEIDNAFKELQDYYRQRHEQVEKTLGISIDGNVIESYFPKLITNEKQKLLTSEEGVGVSELANIKSQLKTEIGMSFVTPSSLIKSMNSQSQDLDSGSIHQLIGQLDSYSVVYQEVYRVIYESDLQEILQNGNLHSTIEKLNSGEGLGLGSDRLRMFAKGARENGVLFAAEDGKIITRIDYRGVAEKLKSTISDDLYNYFHLKSTRLFSSQGQLLIPWNDLGELLVSYEKSFLQSRDPVVKDLIEMEVSSFLYPVFVLGHPSKSLFNEQYILNDDVKEAYSQLIKNHPETFTAKAVADELETLRLNNFEKPERFNKSVVYPAYITVQEETEERN
ncbi:hypothetical protein [Bacillus sp. T33-2]|uniref:hypothetical protein n=1 Tax=Bacillus sp. T33-2 TaxID=2054168 RepID=UPI000C757759|nr:hypothetical protein [Bacillus sp. T33-2]PLR92675.1 hypothetical protein CVD19_20695 [Bacillus sp. T33-2]